MAVALLLGSQSTLAPRSEPARHIATLWWWMLVIASVVFVGALIMLGMAWWRRGRPGLPILGEAEKATTSLVVLFGMVVPVIVLSVVFAVANVVVIKDTEAPASGSTRMTVRVTAHQWWWEARYPGTAAVVANEIHIPARTRVALVAKTADVIHSFWVPQLNRKIDMLPGHTNTILLDAQEPGRYRGQCAEFCGLQHAHMSFWIVADTPARFRAWLARQARPAVEPAGAAARAGEHVFLTQACASCHQIRGTTAKGTVGPDLTHLATRSSLAALTIPNRRADLLAWIRDPQHVKPGNKMPGLALSERERAQVVAFLDGLR